MFFIGEKDEVVKAIEENSDIYSEIIEELEDDEEELINILYVMIEKLHVLKETGDISCVCGSDEIEMTVEGGNIVLTCARCGRSSRIEATGENLTRLLNMSAVVIK